jgi:salicylate hydroxylase
LRSVGQESKHKYNRYWDGYHPKTKEEAENEDNLLFQVSALDAAYWGCLRSHLLREMATHLPEGVVKFGKKLVSCVDNKGSHKVELAFSDGNVATADLGLYSIFP